MSGCLNPLLLGHEETWLCVGSIYWSRAAYLMTVRKQREMGVDLAQHILSKGMLPTAHCLQNVLSFCSLHYLSVAPAAEHHALNTHAISGEPLTFNTAGIQWSNPRRLVVEATLKLSGSHWRKRVVSVGEALRKVGKMKKMWKDQRDQGNVQLYQSWW